MTRAVDDLRARIAGALSVLVGLPMWASGRAADLQWFQFGERRLLDGPRGPREVGSHALHVPCAWRIVRGDVVVVGGRDLYEPADESSERPDDFDWDAAPNRRDARIAALFAGEPRSFLVTGVEVGAAGYIALRFEDALVLEVFPHDSLPDEHWRLFQPGRDAPHLVFAGDTLDES